jgi:hypothetical protein
MNGGLAQHEISGDAAHLGAVKKGTDMIGARVFSAHLQAMTGGFGATPMTIETILNALLHLRA